MKNFKDYQELIQSTMDELLEACPQLGESYYLGGTTPVSVIHLKHAVSMDMDLLTQQAFKPTSQEARKLKDHFKNRLEWFEADHEFGIFRGTLKTDKKEGKLPIEIEIDLFSNFESIEHDHIEQTGFSKIPTISLKGYLEGKLKCIEERCEAKDLYHLYCLTQKPKWNDKVRAGLSKIDGLELRKAQLNFEAEWPTIKDNIRRAEGMPPINNKDLMGWVSSLPDPKPPRKNIKKLCGEPTL